MEASWQRNKKLLKLQNVLSPENLDYVAIIYYYKSLTS